MAAKKQNSAKTIRICTDKHLSYDPHTQLEAYRIAKSKNMRNIPEANVNDKVHLALVRAKFHKVGDTLTVKFMNGTAKQKTKVEEYIRNVEQFVNLKFQFVTSGDADIRIAFKWQGDNGSWSYIGTDIFNIPQNRPTMNFGWLDINGRDTEEYSRTVQHELLHSLGAIHEHQSPAAKEIPWDKPAVYNYYGGPPNNWSKEDVDDNIFETYSTSKTQFSEFDKDSIMLYSIPNELTIGDYEVRSKSVLSPVDKSFIGIIYPKTDPSQPTPENFLNLGDTKKGSIGAYGEEDYYEFELKSDSPTSVILYTEGPTDVVMSLMTADKTVIAWDDDSGQSLNARIRKTLNKGKYIVRIRHYSPKKMGEYSLTLKAA